MTKYCLKVYVKSICFYALLFVTFIIYVPWLFLDYIRQRELQKLRYILQLVRIKRDNDKTAWLFFISLVPINKDVLRKYYIVQNVSYFGQNFTLKFILKWRLLISRNIVSFFLTFWPLYTSICHTFPTLKKLFKHWSCIYHSLCLSAGMCYSFFVLFMDSLSLLVLAFNFNKGGSTYFD